MFLSIQPSSIKELLTLPTSFEAKDKAETVMVSPASFDAYEKVKTIMASMSSPRSWAKDYPHRWNLAQCILETSKTNIPKKVLKKLDISERVSNITNGFFKSEIQVKIQAKAAEKILNQLKAECILKIFQILLLDVSEEYALKISEDKSKKGKIIDIKGRTVLQQNFVNYEEQLQNILFNRFNSIVDIELDRIINQVMKEDKCSISESK
ncbi:MAG: hypothetical protein H0X29_02240 [Parachlamydiaceae bacterium]|nr:hypothetical protein [Parachlamydiaceae bacterium]